MSSSRISLTKSSGGSNPSSSGAQLADGAINYLQNVPNMSNYQVGYDLGFGFEKILETTLVSKGTGFGTSAIKNGVGEAMWQSSTFGKRSILFGRYHSKYVPDGRRGYLNSGMHNGIGWSNHGSRHVFRAKFQDKKLFQIYR
jgi:hypothetical protein